MVVNKTRSAGKSPTCGRPAPRVRVDCQFRYSKFLSQQRHLPNDPENRTVEQRGKWNCVSLRCTSTSGVSIFAPIPFLQPPVLAYASRKAVQFCTCF